MQSMAARPGKGFLQVWFARQFPFRNCLVDSRQILINDPSGAEIQMTDLGIAHLSFRQPDIEAARAQAGPPDIPDKALHGTAFAPAGWRRRFPRALARPPGLMPQPSRINEHHWAGHSGALSDDCSGEQAVSRSRIDKAKTPLLHRHA